jgi:excisionase family DNA binding protein
MRIHNLLNIAEAASLLGLHPSTLRRWADTGKIPHQLTKSGRRRFERAAIEQAQAEMQAITSRNPAQALETKADDLARVHTQDLSAWQPGWLARLSGEQILIFRYSGQRLLGLLMQYISHSETSHTYLDEAKRIAAEYGGIFCKVGLSPAQAAEAFLYFRRSILASVQATASIGGRSDPEGQVVSLRTSDFFDAMLVALIESYAQSKTTENPPAPPLKRGAKSLHPPS